MGGLSHEWMEGRRLHTADYLDMQGNHQNAYDADAFLFYGTLV